MKTKLTDTPFFIFDVESIGLYGEGFAVGGGVYINGKAQWEFNFNCPPNEADGWPDDREWVAAHVPPMEPTHGDPAMVRRAFWDEWTRAVKEFPGITMAGECLYPVEANFVAACVVDNLKGRKWSGPYPFNEIASIMLAAGMSPMATYARQPDELPAHTPLADARLSARLLATACRSLDSVNRPIK